MCIRDRVNTPQTAKLFNNSVDELVTNMRAYIWATPPTDPGPLTVAGQTLADGTNVPAGQVINQDVYKRQVSHCKVPDHGRDELFSPRFEHDRTVYPVFSVLFAVFPNRCPGWR